MPPKGTNRESENDASREQQDAWRNVAPGNMPEDPPEYGEDGLHILNASGDYLADEVLVVTDVSGSGKTRKKAESSDLSEAGTATAPAVDDYKQSAPPLDLAQQKIEESRREQVALVYARRHPTNVFERAFQKVIPYGGIAASAFTIASSTIGGGIIGMPAAFQMSGIGMATIYLVVVCCMAVYSFVLLATVAEKTGLYSWELIARRVMGRGWDYAVVFVMWVLCFGGDISYMIALKSILSGFLRNSPSTSAYLKSEDGARLITFVIWIGIVAPMCLLREINSLRVVSTVAIVFVVFFAITCVIHSGQTLHRRGMRDDLVYFQTGNTAISGLSNLMFGYVSQVNSLTVSFESHKSSPHRMFIAASLGMILCAVLYFFTGLFGYLDFGPTVSDSILSMYNPMEDHLMAVSYVGMMLKICVGFALHLIPCRDCVYYMLNTEASRVPWWQNAVVSTLQAGAALAAGLFIPRISTVFGLLGGFCGGFIGYIFPSFFMMYCGGFTPSRLGWGHFIGTYVLLLAGVIAAVWGTGAAIYGAASADWSTS